MSDRSIQGMLYLRESGIEPRGEEGTGRRLVMVVGLLAVPEDAEIPNEAQVVVAGDMMHDQGYMNLTVLTKHPISYGDRYKGQDMGSLLTEPIWRTR